MILCSNATLLIVDSLLAYLHRRHNANSDQDVRRALAALKMLGERTGAAIVIVPHWTPEALLRATAEGDDTYSALGEARSWLRQVLAAGPRSAKVLESEARTMGITARTYRTARRAEGVIARKEQTLDRR